MARINSYPRIEKPNANDVFILDGADGTRTITYEDMFADVGELKTQLDNAEDAFEAFEEETNAIIKKVVTSSESGDNRVTVNVQHDVNELSMTAISGTVGLYDGMIVLDGSDDENWSLHSSGRFYASGLGISLSSGDGTTHVSSYMYCSNTTSDAQKYFSVGGSGIYISKNVDYQTVDELKEYLAAHPLTVWYKSASYATATLFYQCVTVYSGNSIAGIDFICTYGTDEKFAAIDTSTTVDFVKGTVTTGDTIVGTFTPSSFAQSNTVTIYGGGKITISQILSETTIADDITALNSDIVNVDGKVDEISDNYNNIIIQSILDVSALQVDKTITMQTSIGPELTPTYTNQNGTAASPIIDVIPGSYYSFFLKYTSAGYVCFWNAETGNWIGRYAFSSTGTHGGNPDMWKHTIKTPDEPCVMAVIVGSAAGMLQSTIVLGKTIPTSYIPFGITLKDVDLSEQLDNSADERNLPYLDVVHQNQVPFVRLANTLRGALMYQDIIDNQIITLNRTGKKSHDGTVVKSGDMLYCVYCSYDEGSTGGDAASNDTAVVRLDGISITTGTRTIEEIVAAKGETYGGVEQTGGAGSPNAYLVGGMIHILYTAKMNGTFVEMHCTYDISGGTLSNYAPVQVGGDNLDNAWINAHYSYNYGSGVYLSAQANSTIATDGNGNYYIGWVWSYSTSSWISYSIIFKTTDFVNWEIFKELHYRTIPIYELALAYVSGYVVFFFRPSPAGKNNTGNFGGDDMYGILGKIDVSTGEVVQAVKVQNIGSRPAFFTYDNQLYLFTNTYSRDFFEIISVDTTTLDHSVITSEGYGGYNYPSFCVDNTTIYILYTGQNMPVSHYTPRSVENADVRDTLILLFAT